MLVFTPLPEDQRTAERTHQYSHIECDVVGCGERSPSAAEMAEKGGLAVMGWFIDAGRHRCPKHYHEDDVPAHGPQFRDQ